MTFVVVVAAADVAVALVLVVRIPLEAGGRRENRIDLRIDLAVSHKDSDADCGVVHVVHLGVIVVDPFVAEAYTGQEGLVDSAAEVEVAAATVGLDRIGADGLDRVAVLGVPAPF